MKDFVNENPWFENVKNAFVAIGHNIFDVVRCKNCGTPLTVKNGIFGQHFYCSKKCANIDPRTHELREQTCMKRYGSKTPLLNEECKKKTVETCRKKFGNDMFAGSDEYKKRVPSPFLLKEAREKGIRTKIEKYGEDFGKKIFEKEKEQIMKTNMEKYGVPFVLMNKTKQEQTHDTMQEKYGERYYWRTNEQFQAKLSIGYNRVLSWNDYVIPLFSREEYEGLLSDKIYKWRCQKCGNDFEAEIYTTGIGPDRMVPRCEKCFPNHATSVAEKEVLEFVQSIYSGTIIPNDQTTLSGRKELDIYLPEKKIAIEFDGIYWHSEEMLEQRKHVRNPKRFHLNKLNECIERGIRLIHIFEDEWMNRRAIVKDRISSIIGFAGERIYARKCEVKEISSEISNEFLDLNHLQGGDCASIRYGLYHCGDLVSVMTFGNPPFGTHNALIRHFFVKSVAIADYIAFILPISQLDNDLELYEFDLIHSEDLGIMDYSGRQLHCCFNIFRIPELGFLNEKPDFTLRDITIIEHRRHNDSEKSRVIPDGFDYSMCNWGNGSLGKMPEYVGQYAQEVYFYCHKKEFLGKMLQLLEYDTIRSYCKSISSKRISVMRLYKYLKENIDGVK